MLPPCLVPALALKMLRLPGHSGRPSLPRRVRSGAGAQRGAESGNDGADVIGVFALYSDARQRDSDDKSILSTSPPPRQTRSWSRGRRRSGVNAKLDAVIIFVEKIWRHGAGLSQVVGVAFLVMAALVPFAPWLLPGLKSSMSAGM